MKTASTLIIALVAILAGAVEVKPKAAPLTPDEKAAKHERFLQRTGGVLDRAGEGKLVVADAQTSLETKFLDEYIQPIEKALRMAIAREKVAEPFAVANVMKLKKKLGANSAVFIIDDAQLPPSLIAPEENWGVVNVAALKVDNPEPKTYDRRVRKVFLRVLALTFGAYVINDATSPLQSVKDIADLDGMVITGLTIRELTGMNEHLPKIGVTPAKRTTYLRACRDGWAPPPTNDYQKAVWEQVKADKERGPTNPIPIPPPNAKK
ncbi:MAG: hypothetical protein J6V72_22080 [Kiritimatiellae bacterium]|nr:hypothetical protein [Kiritimatiellia bacterium]